MKTSPLFAAAVTNIRVLVLAALFMPASLQAIQITFSFAGAAGNEASLGPDAQPAGISVGSVTRGSGLTPDTAAEAFNSINWTTAATRDLNDYYAFNVTPQAGISLTLTRLELDERRSGTGIRSWSIYSSLDSFATALETFLVPDDLLTRVNEGVNLGSAFAGLTTGVEFRIYGFGAEGGSGSWRIDNLELSATTAAINVPEGGSRWANWLLAGFAIVVARRFWSSSCPERNSR